MEKHGKHRGSDSTRLTPDRPRHGNNARIGDRVPQTAVVPRTRDARLTLLLMLADQTLTGNTALAA